MSRNRKDVIALAAGLIEAYRDEVEMHPGCPKQSASETAADFVAWMENLDTDEFDEIVDQISE